MPGLEAARSQPTMAQTSQKEETSAPASAQRDCRCRGCHGDAGLTSHFLLFQELKRYEEEEEEETRLAACEKPPSFPQEMLPCSEEEAKATRVDCDGREGQTWGCGKNPGEIFRAERTEGPGSCSSHLPSTAPRLALLCFRGGWWRSLISWSTADQTSRGRIPLGRRVRSGEAGKVEPLPSYQLSRPVTVCGLHSVVTAEFELSLPQGWPPRESL